MKNRVRSNRKRIQKRDPWLDNIKGLMIICVVLGHLDSPILKTSRELYIFYNLINFVDIPCFLFLSGFLAKRKIDQKDYRGMLTKLVIPYYLTDLVFWAFACMFPNALYILSYLSTMNPRPLVPKYHLWYLFAIMVYYLITPLFADRCCGWRAVLVLLISFAFSLLSGYSKEIQCLKLTKLIAYYPPFLLGYYFRKEWLYALRDKLICKLAAIPVLAFWIYFFIQNHDRIYSQVFFVVKPYENYPHKYTEYLSPVWQRGLFLATSVIVAFAVMSLITKHWTPLAFLGKRSLYVYVIHGFFILAIRTWNQYRYPFYDLIDTNQKIIYLQLAGVIFAFLLASKPFTWLFRPILEPQIPLPRREDKNQSAAESTSEEHL